MSRKIDATLKDLKDYYWIIRQGESMLTDLNQANLDLMISKYRPRFVSELSGVSPEKNILYVKIENNILKYRVISPLNKDVTGDIPLSLLNITNPAQVKTEEQLRMLLPAILQETSQKNHTEVVSGIFREIMTVNLEGSPLKYLLIVDKDDFYINVAEKKSVSNSPYQKGFTQAYVDRGNVKLKKLQELELPGQLSDKESEVSPNPESSSSSSKKPKKEPRGDGWKLHISFQNNPPNIKKAWEIIMELFHQHRMPATKIIRISKFEDLDVQDGKQITIYLGDTALITRYREGIYTFLKSLNQQLEAADIPALSGSANGDIFVPEGDLNLWNSKYIAYTNDLDENGEYVDSDRRKLSGRGDDFMALFPDPISAGREESTVTFENERAVSSGTSPALFQPRRQTDSDSLTEENRLSPPKSNCPSCSIS